MNEREQIALIDRLRGMPEETEWFQRKRNPYAPEGLGAELLARAKSSCTTNLSRRIGRHLGIAPIIGRL